MKTALLKWSFTWGLAFLPIVFGLAKQWLDGNWNLALICSSGEFFLVSIVVLAEPLHALIFSKQEKTNSTRALVTLTLILLFSFVYIFSAQENRKEQLGEKHHTILCKNCKSTNSVAFSQAELKKDGEWINFAKRVEIISITTFVCALILGGATVALHGERETVMVQNRINR